MDDPMFRPLKHNGRTNRVRRAMDPDAIDRVVPQAGRHSRPYARLLRAHSMTFFHHHTALENGAQLEDVLITLSMMCEFRPCSGSFENHDRRQHILYTLRAIVRNRP